MFDAMVFKREIFSGCSIAVEMLDTLKDGLVLSIDQDLVKDNDLEFIKNFVNQHNLSLLLDSERYFISSSTLVPSSQHLWES